MTQPQQCRPSGKKPTVPRTRSRHHIQDHLSDVMSVRTKHRTHQAHCGRALICSGDQLRCSLLILCGLGTDSKPLTQLGALGSIPRSLIRACRSIELRNAVTTNLSADHGDRRSGIVQNIVGNDRLGHADQLIDLPKPEPLGIDCV